MKKLLFLFASVFLLSACQPEEIYNKYSFPAVFGGKPFTVQLDPAYSEFHLTDQYANRLIIASIFPRNCSACKSYAPYFERLAEEFQNTSIEFVAIFLNDDINEIAQLPWVQEFKHVKPYANVLSPTCPKDQTGICLKVFHFFAKD